MENIEIIGKKDVYFIPTVKFNASNGKLLIEGESYLEDTRAFYFPLIKWVETFINEKKLPIVFDVNLSYYNTSSSKHILEILYQLKDFESQGGQVTINWHYVEDDDIEEEIEDFELECGLKFNRVKNS